MDYLSDIVQYVRYKTREVKIGNISIGGNNPIRVQSMTTTDTMDTQGTVEQTLRMVESGCEIVRITAPSKKEAENLKNIREALHARGCFVPLVADIHYTPNAAEVAARIVEKVRVNPGNYADKKKFEHIEYNDDTYAEELTRIEERFTPLIQICKEHQTALRIGTNHGSLSDRIMSRYGDTPLGMVESAMEFIRICEKNNFHQLVVSMKSSNTQVMVQAYRLLIQQMEKEGMNYPLHLGVTEAGDGEDGRIKSAVGIGTLLLDGLGDTIRVSLTEDPEFEAPVAHTLRRRFPAQPCHLNLPQPTNWEHSPYAYHRADSNAVGNIGNKQVPVVVADMSHPEELKPAHFFPLGYQYSVPLDKWNIQDIAADYVYVGKLQCNFELPGTLGLIQDLDAWTGGKQCYPLLQWGQRNELPTNTPGFLEVSLQNLLDWPDHFTPSKDLILVLTGDSNRWMTSVRWMANELIQKGVRNPVVFAQKYESTDLEELQLDAGADFGGLFIDGYGDGIWLNSNELPQPNLSLAFGVLQATRTRISKTEYISCPSCGRTLFDLQETTGKIRSVTQHLKGIKIGIMGCIVNGPGEMADADYGYVGSGPGKITLYKEKEVMKRNVPSEQAVEELIGLIREHGDWVEPTAG